MAKQRQKVTFADELLHIQENLACPGCSKRYLSPRLLPCLHTICKRCVEDEKVSPKNGKVSGCPVCGLIFDAHTSIPVNFVVNNIVTSAAFSENSKYSFACDSCDSHDERVTMRCNDCYLFLCEFCTTAHRRMNSTKGHQLQSIDELRSTDRPLVALHRPHFCFTHPSESICYFCQTCEATVCRECVISHHEGHQLRTIEEAAKTVKLNMVTLCEQTRVKQKRLQKHAMSTQEVITQASNKDLKTRASIEDYFKKLIAALKRRMDTLLSEFDTRSKSKLQRLHSQRSKFENTLLNANSCCLFTECAVKQGSDMEVLSVGHIILRRFVSLLKDAEQIPSLKSAPNSQGINFVVAEDKVLDIISKLGSLAESQPSSPTDPAHCTLSPNTKVLHLTAGEVGRMSLTAVNHQGQKQCNGGDKVSLSISQPNSRAAVDKASFRCNSHDNQDGTYTLAYAITRADTYWLRVRVNGCPVGGSPLTVTVRPTDWISSQRVLRGKECGGLSNPYSVIIDTYEHMIVADSHNHRIKILSLKGDELKTIGSQGSKLGQFNFPYCLALNNRGNCIIVSDGQNHRVQIFTTSGKLVKSFGGFGADDGKLNHPHGVVVDFDNRIYVADSGNSRVQIFSPDGVPVGKIACKGLACPWGVAITQSGQIAVTDYNNHKVCVFKRDGTFGFEFGSRGTGDGEFNNPAGIVANDEGQLLVADRSNHRVQIFQPSGSFVTKFGGKGQDDGLMRFPAGVAVDHKGHLYVADTFNNRVQVFSLASV